jgi:superfamily II DNA or RNA helicase
MHLRDYQEQGIQAILAAAQKGRRLLYVLPTGGGKTVMFCELARRLNKRALVMVHRDFLCGQVRAALAQAGANCDVKMITAAGRVSEHYDLLIIDEAHHAVSRTWSDAISNLEKINPDLITVGVTATPERLDGRGLGDLFSKMIQGPQVAELIERGYLATPVTFAPPAKISTEGLKVMGGDYNREELATRAATITGDVIEHYLKLAGGKRAVGFTPTVDCAESYCAAFNRAGIAADIIHGGHNMAQRESLIRRFREGEIRVLFSCEVISEGFDLPAIEAAILLRPTKSLACFLQQAGRALRPAPGKDKAIVIDHTQNTEKHGLVSDERKWSLETKKRVKRTVEKLCWTCRVCCAQNPLHVDVCENCGAARATEPREAPKHVEGDLVEVKSRRRKMSREEIRKLFREEKDNRKIVQTLLEVGYKMGFIRIEFRFRGRSLS